MKKKEQINDKEDILETETKSKNEEAKWYIVQTYSGYENSVREDLLKLANSGLPISKFIFEVICPKEKYFKIKSDGTKQEKERKMFSGYVFVKMIITEHTWFVVRNLPQVTNFLGSIKGNNAKPVPLNDSEIKPILIKIGLIKKPSYEHLINKKVEITGGSFVGKIGTVSFIDSSKNIMVVEVDLFGRNTPIEISLSSFKEIT
ncbi:transcription termination/antitermination factor NusG [Candidatus Phytoplasma ziziphi]|uniref:Transcription termination/antitermination protein NusG n=1 Tax=Ziziphus jujuba witches'-broom phytoplasma TaxID=135727 RepID=A0A660HN87_ZIZJU|nr:transcription termination/antitermination protein NusG [Candidatus Phytoplasma ziziphi]AYJ01339.1 transcription termination/antitermination factor NusG [Candidatus Phytoplasma ziziphi]